MNPIKKNILYLTAICFLCISSFAFDPETKKIMPFVSSKSSCIKCHQMKNFHYDKNDPAIACDASCLECHKNMDKHHSVGIRPDNRLRPNLRLTQKNKIACITCHDLNFNRFDDASWRSESLFEKLFNKKDSYKTYYLIINNSDGQLCKKCH
jgi:nitrate/TMAO reductase-like tetraheme cytochrome c subunit